MSENTKPWRPFSQEIACTEPLAEPSVLHPSGMASDVFFEDTVASFGFRQSARVAAQPLTESTEKPTTKTRHFLFNSKPLALWFFHSTVSQKRDRLRLLFIVRSLMT